INAAREAPGTGETIDQLDQALQALGGAQSLVGWIGDTTLAVVANGTDVPVERISPIASYYSTVSRMTPEGWKFYPQQALTRMEALKTYTLNNAYAGFEEDTKGSLTPGKYADITVLDRDILTVPEEEIPDTRVVMTIVGGEIRYRGGEAMTAMGGSGR
ncbi:MAG: amidohydrolase family protein, partial [Gemmatimonadetes bacterium]|nr:amidohydrolase family protein [Gemmatimonadota bacterium]